MDGDTKHAPVILNSVQDFAVGIELKKKKVEKKSENNPVAERNCPGESMWLTPWQLLAWITSGGKKKEVLAHVSAIALNSL